LSVNGPPSPWWYRNRGPLIGAIYGCGFFLGYLQFGSAPAAPAAVTWGLHWGAWGVYSLFWAGIQVALLGWLVRFLGTAYLRGDVVFAADVQRDRLIVAGPFSFTRNPLYLGNDLLALGLGLYAPPVGFAIIALGNIIFGIILAGEEQQQLLKQYGAEYVAYSKAVPPFLPRLMPAKFPVNATVTPSWRNAFRTESWALALALAPAPIALAGARGTIASGLIWVAAIGLFVAISHVSRAKRSPMPRSEDDR
jgi:protein-S-isoprenylcysteine O-methyltransferase Ste14